MEVIEIQEAVPVVADRLPDADRRLNRPSVTSRIKSFFKAAVAYFTINLRPDEGRRPVEHANKETTVLSGKEEPVRVVVEESTATSDMRLEQSADSSDYKSVFEVITVALAIAGASFTVMYAVPGGLNELGSAVVGDTIGFIVFLVTDMVSFLASMAIAMIVATVSHISPKMDNMIRMSLWAAGVSFIFSFHAAAYVVVLPKHKWIVLCFGCTITLALVLLLLYRLTKCMFHHDFGKSRMRNEGMRFPGGHFPIDSKRSGKLKRRRKI